MTTRRSFLAGAAAAGSITVLPFRAGAEAHMGANTFETDGGQVVVHPVHHASIVLETPAGVIYVDPVGGAGMYADMPAADLILITHEHGDHYDADTLEGLQGEAPLVVNPAVMDMLPEALAARATAIGNGESTDALGTTIEAIPAYNITEGRTDFHPEGRDNGYVMTIDGFTIYVSGDTEATEEMMALSGIDLAFVSMNLPYTMTAEQAAEGVNAFAPSYVYPYHYRGQDGGTQDPEAFAAMLQDGIESKMGDWYEPGELEG
ncbi:MBL fold metallo-hydrolase [Wenxinia saemankumensis]|nr:MBL fold metallo-hydrolase [Wenxinia saemankumensis]